jgi:hypothetical protein
MTRKLAIIDKNPDAKFTQWRAAAEPKKFFHKDNSLATDIKKYDPDFIFINKGNTFKNIPSAIAGKKSIYFYGDYYRPIPKYVPYYSSLCSAVVLTNKDRALWRSLGNKNIYFASQGVDVEIFKPVCMKKKYDVIFAGNYYGTKFLGSDIRLEFARYIKNLPYKTEIIGDGWPLDIDALPRQGMADLNQSINASMLTAGMSHFIDVPFYTSNRLYQSMATGVPHIAWHSPKVRSIFRHGYLEVSSYKQMSIFIKKLLKHHEMRLNIGMRQFSEIRNYHTIFDFWNKIEKIMKDL